MRHIEKQQKIKKIIETYQLSGLILGELYNIQYATGVRIEAAHAQPDLPIFALFLAGADPIIIVPTCWQTVAAQESFFPQIVAYRNDHPPLQAAIETLLGLIPQQGPLGIDSDCMSVVNASSIVAACAARGLDLRSIDEPLAAARAVKTEEEVAILKRIALKTDHVINGHFHHLSADRPKSASSISESLRVHSSERDIEIAGYNASARAVLGESLSSIWAYAPKYGFADAEMTQAQDAIIADVLTSEAGYWSNATRIAVSNDHMTQEQAAAYAELVALRQLLLAELVPAQMCGDIYRAVVAQAKSQNLRLITALPLGFCVGVSPMEGPFWHRGRPERSKHRWSLSSIRLSKRTASSIARATPS